jgi:hypothetical protein
MMKTGLLTFHSAHHYGAQLQAYALMKAIMNTGADCEIINYVRIDTVEGKRLFKKGFSARTLLSNAHTILNYSLLKKRHDRFEGFISNEMRLSEKFYGTYEALLKDKPEYDAYVCGSDQIWNPLIFKENTFDPAFFADFAERGRRIAYAPSFGIAEIPEDKKEDLRRYLDRFECLSVREKQGEKIIRDVAGRESLTVLDPTLLLTGEEWNTYAEVPAYKEPYILCYFISDPGNYSGYVKALSEKYKLPVVSLCGARRVVPQTRHTVLDAGPREFLGLFSNAALVCTNSFHGTVFSINFKKDFYSFASVHNSEKTVNSRLYNILEKLGLLPRLVLSDVDVNDFSGRISSESGMIDYSIVNALLQSEREISCSYLKESLQLSR